MNRIAQFEKVSLEQFKKDWEKTFKGWYHDYEKEELYNNIKLPCRATKHSAGHDIFSPETFYLKPNQSMIIPTGIRVKMEEGWVLKCYPRSSLGFKFKMQIDNTVPIIDGDYYHSDNEGHIFIKITNDSREDKVLHIKEGDAFVQGIFVEYGITYDDDVTTERNGGIGSTTKK